MTLDGDFFPARLGFFYYFYLTYNLCLKLLVAVMTGNSFDLNERMIIIFVCKLKPKMSRKTQSHIGVQIVLFLVASWSNPSGSS